ncbi:MAG TPA: hypothetical protein VMU86_06855 [Steroidobacteraceae bacterium]|nr:hypothetical protein [Steroidobacteraceae bacterium]
MKRLTLAAAALVYTRGWMEIFLQFLDEIDDALAVVRFWASGAIVEMSSHAPAALHSDSDERLWEFDAPLDMALAHLRVDRGLPR